MLCMCTSTASVLNQSLNEGVVKKPEALSVFKVMPEFNGGYTMLYSTCRSCFKYNLHTRHGQILV